MIENIHSKVVSDINTEGYAQYDNRLGRHTRAINGYVVVHHYLEGVEKLPNIKDKYKADWIRMYPSYRNACDEVIKDPNTRRACLFNTSQYHDIRDTSGDIIREGTYPCFLMMQVIHRENGTYDFIVYQRSSDLSKLEDDIRFFEYIIVKIQRRSKIRIDRIEIHYGSIHYETNG